MDEYPKRLSLKNGQSVTVASAADEAAWEADIDRDRPQPPMPESAAELNHAAPTPESVPTPPKRGRGGKS